MVLVHWNERTFILGNLCIGRIGCGFAVIPTASPLSAAADKKDHADFGALSPVKLRFIAKL
jgi:hypothetical protein